MSDQQEHKPKIIVDDDWKARVQAEREALKQQEEQEPQGKAGTTEDASGGPEQLPPASFPFLVTSLATQAIAALGQIPDPEQQQPIVRLDIAKHTIDTLAVLEEKTKGNLTPDEAAMLTNVLHELRMLFVSVKNAPTQPPDPGSM